MPAVDGKGCCSSTCPPLMMLRLPTTPLRGPLYRSGALSPPYRSAIPCWMLLTRLFSYVPLPGTGQGGGQ